MEQFIKTKELSYRLGLGVDAAKAVMIENGVFPVSLGVGRGRGLRWLASAVDAVIRTLHEKAQPIHPQQKQVRTQQCAAPDLTKMTVDEIFELTHAPTSK